MQTPFYSIISNQSEQTAEILLYGLIGADLVSEGNAAKAFLKDFQALEKTAQRINIRINSPGGSVWEGLPIFNAIRSSKCEVHTYIDGIAYSMAAMIALAGHQIHMAQGSLLMLHNVSSGQYGNAEKMRQAAQTMDKYDAILMDLIAHRSGQSLDYVKTHWMNYSDNYFTPEEAKAASLIDIIESYTAENIPRNIKLLSPFQVAAFYQKQEDRNPKTLFEKVADAFKTNKHHKPSDMQEIKKRIAQKATLAAKKYLNAVQNELEELGESVTEETPATQESDLKQLLDRFEKLLDRLDSSVEEQEEVVESIPEQLEALKKRVNAMAARPTSPYVQADKLQESKKESFETSFDRQAKASLIH